MASNSGSKLKRNFTKDVCVFFGSGTFTPNFNGTVEVLVVAGGGGGGMDMGGGGGGGAVVYNNSYSVSAGTPINVTVGAGGAGAPAAGTLGQPGSHYFTISATNGGNSVFGSITANGGGYGASSYHGYTPNYGYGGTGGNGGGASGYSGGNSGDRAGTGNQGYNGGATGGQYYSGGGGGAGGSGQSGGNGNGGPGVLNTILDVDFYWGGGGGGSAYSLDTGGQGGIGGGGGGAVGYTTGGKGYNSGQPGGGGAPASMTNMPGGHGGKNTGGGGGGGSHYNGNNAGGNGGSGIVIVRWNSALGDSTTLGGIIDKQTALKMLFDASNIKSVTMPTKSLINSESWTEGIGNVAGYDESASLGLENYRLYDTDPWGNQSIVWETRAKGDGVADGGFNGVGVTISNITVPHRYSIWVRRTTDSSAGTTYFGTTSTVDSNPYFDVRATSWYAKDVWHLVVGVVFPVGYTGSYTHQYQGIYTIKDGKVATISGSMPTPVQVGTTTSLRAYHYYDTADNTTRTQFIAPRIEPMDGTESSIDGLLRSGPNQSKNLINNRTLSTIMPNLVYDRKSAYFNGTTSQINTSYTGQGASSELSMEAWVNPATVQNTYAGILGNHGKAGYDGFGIQHYNGSWYPIYGDSATWRCWLDANFAFTLSPNIWWHLVIVKSTTQVIIYLNATPIITRDITFNIYPSPIPSIVKIGNDYAPDDSASRKFTGYIGQASVYESALSHEDVIAIFNAKRSMYNVGNSTMIGSKFVETINVNNKTWHQVWSLDATGSIYPSGGPSGYTNMTRLDTNRNNVGCNAITYQELQSWNNDGWSEVMFTSLLHPDVRWVLKRSDNTHLPLLMQTFLTGGNPGSYMTVNVEYPVTLDFQQSATPNSINATYQFMHNHTANVEPGDIPTFGNPGGAVWSTGMYWGNIDAYSNYGGLLNQTTAHGGISLGNTGDRLLIYVR